MECDWFGIGVTPKKRYPFRLLWMMMAKMKYSEIPRDLSSDSMAAFRLAQVNNLTLNLNR